MKPHKINMGKVPILCERPENMDYEEYRTHRKLYQQMLKLYRKVGLNGAILLNEKPDETDKSKGGSEVDTTGD